MCAPLLCLFSKCNLMVTTNKDALNGIANGTPCIFQKVVLKPGFKLDRIQMYGCWVHTILMEAVSTLKWSGKIVTSLWPHFETHLKLPHSESTIQFPNLDCRSIKIGGYRSIAVRKYINRNSLYLKLFL
jgi:hypothetical protein